MIAPTSIVAERSRSATSASPGFSWIRCRSLLYALRPCTRSYQEMTMLSKSR